MFVLNEDKRVTLDKILEMAGWSNECTFRNHYEIPVTKMGEFPEALQSAAAKKPHRWWQKNLLMIVKLVLFYK